MSQSFLHPTFSTAAYTTDGSWSRGDRATPTFRTASSTIDHACSTETSGGMGQHFGSSSMSKYLPWLNQVDGCGTYLESSPLQCLAYNSTRRSNSPGVMCFIALSMHVSAYNLAHFLGYAR